MYCPQCGSEYREGVTVCTECGKTLTLDPPVDAPKPEADWVELETVLESSDPALLAVARSLLEAEGISCFARGDVVQDFLGLGRLPTGTNLITGPVQLQVPAERSAEARELLAAVDNTPFETPADELTEE